MNIEALLAIIGLGTSAVPAVDLTVIAYRRRRRSRDALEHLRLTGAFGELRTAAAAQAADPGTAQTLRRYAESTGRAAPYEGRHRLEDQSLVTA